MGVLEPFQQATSGLKRHDGQAKRVWLGVLLIMLLACVLLPWYAVGAKTVTLVVDGEPLEVETRHEQLSELLEELEIDLRKHDRISKPVFASLEDGDVVTIKRAFPIRLIDGGRLSREYTTASTVAEALEEIGIELGEEDEIYPDQRERITANATVHIVRVDKTFTVEEETIPFRTVEQRDDRLLKGTREVVQEGRDGKRIKTIEQIWKDGQLVSEQVVNDVVAVEQQDRIVTVGTKAPVQVLSASSPNIGDLTRDGITFGVKKIIDNVTLTAYDAGFNSTGKTEDHPAYGVTYTGSIVQEGRTAAVDPEVIPLGWWFYIEGVGFRRAEDTGSAIKGNKIDIYMESEQQANRFGRKRGYTVYVIGPEKPSAL